MNGDELREVTPDAVARLGETPPEPPSEPTPATTFREATSDGAPPGGAGTAVIGNAGQQLSGAMPGESAGGGASALTPPPSLPSNDKSLGALVMEITQDFSKLMRKEVELAKQETTEMVRTKLLAAGLGVVGAVLGLFLVPFVLFTIYQILALWVPNWVAALIVTLVTAAGCGGAFLAAKSKFEGKLKPERTIRTLKEDVQWAKHLKK